ncbi:uncharacterized protein B0H18DRAFT_987525 [Fomitopsis serialis]|uniref:uncharacterized protein n=1 Tax=Fomitopsis serialis TaxID=139415 RepID=UPI0020081B69|nr:uncharacterized protein B0H18DRAFT_987525 [Neoantrodia serialis]KAH9932309.1 hypothetical protein B0H18DRAFT_987525 [Neoantrodia serialis]
MDNSGPSILDQAENLGFTRDEDFWYDDGSIILIAQDVGFRVYRGLLVKLSEIFRDLFTVPQPPHGQLVCGCPVVHLPDTAASLREFLEALLHGKRYVPEDDGELDHLSYRIRLSHKYGIEYLLKESIQQLQALFPTRFDDWADLNPSGPYSALRAITAVNLARLTDTPSILPSAIYACCQLLDQVLLEGATHLDGTIETLGRGDLIKCMKAKVKFTCMQTHMVHQQFRVAVAQLSTENRGPGILEPWGDLLCADSATVGIADANALRPCARCMSDVGRRIDSEHREWWCSLPEDVGIEVDDWE